jgi:hypothetical protein
VKEEAKQAEGHSRREEGQQKRACERSSCQPCCSEASAIRVLLRSHGIALSCLQQSEPLKEHLRGREEPQHQGSQNNARDQILALMMELSEEIVQHVEKAEKRQNPFPDFVLKGIYNHDNDADQTGDAQCEGKSLVQCVLKSKNGDRVHPNLPPYHYHGIDAGVILSLQTLLS